jgi:hypothetical protein
MILSPPRARKSFRMPRPSVLSGLSVKFVVIEPQMPQGRREHKGIGAFRIIRGQNGTADDADSCKHR